MNPSRRNPILAAVLATVLVFSIVAPARSADGDAPTTADSPAAPAPASAERTERADPPAIERLRVRGLNVKPGGIIGRDLRFWLIMAKDGQQAFAVTTSDGHLVLGKIFSPDGSLSLNTEGERPLFLDAEDRRAHGLARLTGAPARP